MHRIRLLNVFVLIFALMAQAHRELISIDLKFCHNYKV